MTTRAILSVGRRISVIRHKWENKKNSWELRSNDDGTLQNHLNRCSKVCFFIVYVSFDLSCSLENWAFVFIWCLRCFSFLIFQFNNKIYYVPFKCNRKFCSRLCDKATKNSIHMKYIVVLYFLFLIAISVCSMHSNGGQRSRLLQTIGPHRFEYDITDGQQEFDRWIW